MYTHALSSSFTFQHLPQSVSQTLQRTTLKVTERPEASSYIVCTLFSATNNVDQQEVSSWNKLHLFDARCCNPRAALRREICFLQSVRLQLQGCVCSCRYAFCRSSFTFATTFFFFFLNRNSFAAAKSVKKHKKG